VERVTPYHVTPYEPVEIYDWLRWQPAYTNARGSQSKRLGAHAFMPEDGDGNGSMSLCGYAARSKAGSRASREDRRCIHCERVIVGRSPRFGRRR
jgi:hypothetical protein